MNVLLLKGDIGREGSGPCPVRGHSNVQGDRTVGITHAPSTAFLGRLNEEFGVEMGDQHGADSVNSVLRMNERGGVFLSLGGNFLSAMSDTEHTAQSMERCIARIVISTNLSLEK